MQAVNPGTVIISRTDSIGDVMLTLPLAGLIKKHFPECKVIFLGRNYTCAVVSCCVHVDEFLSWDEMKALEDPEKLNVLKALKADAILHVFPDIAIASLARRAQIPLRAGTSHRFYHFLSCNRLLNFSRKGSALHEAQLNLKLAIPLGIKTDMTLDAIADLSGFTHTKALPDTFAALLAKDKFNLILHPRSKGSAREWGLENYSALIKHLPEDRFRIFLSGTAEEGAALADFIQKHPQVTNLTGKLSLDELISFIQHADGLVAASTGPLHIAAALGKKAIGIFAPMKPIHPGRWAPIGKHAVYFVKDESCSDCRKSGDCHCIREVHAEKVAEELMRSPTV
jgi:heptosyltransferase-3